MVARESQLRDDFRSESPANSSSVAPQIRLYPAGSIMPAYCGRAYPHACYNPAVMPEQPVKSEPVKQPDRMTSGPKWETLEPFNGTFEQAIDKALGKKKPAGRLAEVTDR